MGFSESSLAGGLRHGVLTAAYTLSELVSLHFTGRKTVRPIRRIIAHQKRFTVRIAGVDRIIRVCSNYPIDADVRLRNYIAGR